MNNCQWRAGGCTHDAEYEVATKGMGRGHVLMCGSCAKIFIDGMGAYHLHHFIWAKHLVDGSMLRKLEKAPDDPVPVSDPVDHPKHYNVGKFEVIDVIEDWRLGFNDGNAVKYIARHMHKDNPVEDLKKARWYLEREILRLELQAQGRAVHPMGEAEPGTEVNEIIAALANLTPKQQDEVTEGLLATQLPWGTKRGALLVARAQELPLTTEARSPQLLRVRFEFAGTTHATEIDVDLSEPLVVAVEQVLQLSSWVRRGKWETRNSQGDRLLLDDPLNPLDVPDGKVVLCSVPGSGG